MKRLNNERGAVLVFITLMIVLLLIMVGLGLDTGHLAYIRSQGQPAVDAAALSAASAIPSGRIAGNANEVYNRAAQFNASNNYLNSPNNPIPDAAAVSPDKSITLVQYDASTGAITTAGVDINNANGVRVALESKNPHTAATTDRPMKSPLFLAPLFNLFGQSVANTTNVSVSAVAVLGAQPDLPIAAEASLCGTKVGGVYVEQQKVKLIQSNTKSDTSGYTTFYVPPTSKTQIEGFLTGARNCVSAPPVDIGFCTELNNGQIASIYDDFETLFNIDQSRCYFIPIVTDGVSYTGCSNILDFAKFCPKPCVDCNGGKTNSFGTDKASSGSDRWIYGSLKCGLKPTNTDTRCQVPRLVRDPVSGM